MKIMKMLAVSGGIVFALTGAINAEVQNLVAFNLKPELRSRIVAIAAQQDIAVSSSNALRDVDVLFYGLDTVAELLYLPSFISPKDRGKVASGPLTFTPISQSSQTGIASNFILMNAVRELGQDYSDGEFDCATVRLVASILVANATGEEPAQVSRRTTC